MTTVNMEDYLEKIYLLIEEKGAPRAAGVAAVLEVLPSSVSKMLKKLDEKGLVKYEKYRGFTLTPKGSSLAEDIADKHYILERLFHVLDIPSENAYKEIEGMEHHIGKETSFCFRSLIRFLEENPDIRHFYLQYREEQIKRLRNQGTRL